MTSAKAERQTLRRVKGRNTHRKIRNVATRSGNLNNAPDPYRGIIYGKTFQVSLHRAGYSIGSNQRRTAPEAI